MKNKLGRFSRCFAVVGSVILFFGVSSAPAKPAVKKLLVVTITAGYRHPSVTNAEATLKQLGGQTGIFSVEVAKVDPDSPEFRGADGSTDTNKVHAAMVKVLAEKMSTAALKKYDGVIFANTTGDLPLPDKAAFLKWLKSGKAFIGMHAATDTFRGHKPPDPFIEMIGGEFQSHPKGLFDVECLNQDPKHPACASVPLKWPVKDEIYMIGSHNPKKVHYLLKLDKHPKEGTPGDFPIAWCKMFGKGKVFYTSLGHGAEMWANPDYQKHIIGGIEWALGLKKGDATPQAK